MSFWRDCWSSVRGNMREFASTPLSRKKLLVFGGVFLVIVVLIIILIVSLSGSSSSADPVNGSSVLKDGPTTYSYFDANIIKIKFKNQLNSTTVDDIANLISIKNLSQGKLGTMVWLAGASSCNASQKDAAEQTLESVDLITRLIEQSRKSANFSKKLALVTNSADQTTIKNNDQIGVIISLDGGYTIDSRLALLRVFQKLGVRIFTLYGPCAVPWFSGTALADFGMKIVNETSRLGMLLDVARMPSSAVQSVIDIAKVPVIFQGVGAKSKNANSSNVDDDTLGKIKGGKGVVMVSFDCNLIRNTTDQNCTSKNVIEHVKYIANIAGKESVGLSTSYYDVELPTDMKFPQNVSIIFDELHKDGWSLDELRGLAYKNFFNALKKAEELAQNDRLPLDDLENEKELKSLGSNLSCYTDLDIRYKSIAVPTPPPPKTPTSNNETKPAK